MHPKSVFLCLPHQLYAEEPLLCEVDEVWLIEHPLFFTQFAYHQHKLTLHRASMSAYLAKLLDRGIKARRLEFNEIHQHGLDHFLLTARIEMVKVLQPNDDWALTSLKLAAEKANCKFTIASDEHFLTPESLITSFTKDRRKLFFTDFYVQQRRRLGILLEDNNPKWGKWSFDTENRKRLPKNIHLPTLPPVAPNSHCMQAKTWTRQNFSRNPGSCESFSLPVDSDTAQLWLDDFIEKRLSQFGPYEDAISSEHTVLFHSVITPLLNIGLLTPQQICSSAISKIDTIPPASLEGFIRQIIGWREFVRLVYLSRGRRQRSSNFWNHSRKLPASFYNGETGILPFDTSVKRVLKHGYCHHIERLMILGNFMLLCEIDPHEVYRWFMELFVDSYDWVMVPNVYGMSQYADGGFMTTKPYISGSNYILKMSNYKRASWCETWDALYWRFIWKHQAFFSKNPRLSVMTLALNKMGNKIDAHRAKADKFLDSLS